MTPSPDGPPIELVLFNKPQGVLSQFTPEGRWCGLRDFIDLTGVYVAGRLDADSEGLLLLTSDGRLQARIADPPACACSSLPRRCGSTSRRSGSARPSPRPGWNW